MPYHFNDFVDYFDTNCSAFFIVGKHKTMEILLGIIRMGTKVGLGMELGGQKDER